MKGVAVQSSMFTSKIFKIFAINFTICPLMYTVLLSSVTVSDQYMALLLIVPDQRDAQKRLLIKVCTRFLLD